MGEFTACLADPYPSGETEVYGPGDFEFRSAGTILDVILGVLEEVDDPESPSGVDASCASWIVSEMAPEASLDHDVRAAQKMLGDSAVMLTQLGIEYWRVRLLVKVQHQNLSTSVCSAWGLDPRLPLCVELRLPTSGYTFESVGRCVVQRITQEGFEDFALESQLVQILGDFCQLCRDGSWKNWSQDSVEVPETDSEENQLYYESKKKRLIVDAMNNKNSGFLVCLANYLQLRVPTMHEFCAICDKAFKQPPMMMRTVCAEELCTYQFGEFGSKITTAESVNHPSEILDLLVCMLTAAAEHLRRKDILDPFPLVQLPGQGTILHPQEKNFERLLPIVAELFKVRSMWGKTMGASWATQTSAMSPEAAALLKWTVSSNRSYLAPLEDSQRIEAFRTPFQYLLLSAPPEKEQRFQELKKQFGTSFAFHGSSAENWHSILRNGLKNASYTKLMTAGAAHGPGIYLATDSKISFHYTRSLKRAADQPAPLKRQRTGNRFVDNTGGLAMMAICEVISDQEKLKKPKNGIWVATTEELVCTRFFLVFETVPEENVKISALEQDLRTLAEKVRVF